MTNVVVQRKRLTRISQGDVFSDVECIEHVSEKKGIVEVSKIVFPLVVVLTQDCDLEQDFNGRAKERQGNTLLSVLVVPLYNAEHVFTGEHLSELKITGTLINKTKTEGKSLMQNERPRYHYIDFPANIPVVASIADFKHYFSVHTSYLEKVRAKSFVCRLDDLFREDLSQRFSAYLGRIGLPSVGA